MQRVISPGSLGAGSAHERPVVVGLEESWRRLRVVHEWWIRIQNYENPGKRTAQLAADAVDLPLKLLDALGFETNAIPLTKLWSKEIEFLIEFLKSGSQAQAQVADARRKWVEAARIAKELAPRADHAAARSQAPRDKSYVWKWNSIVRWLGIHARDHRFVPGIFMGQGYDYFRVSSLAQLRNIGEGCQLQIYRHAGRLGFVYLLLRIQQVTLTRLASSSQRSLESMMEGKNAIAQIAGATAATSLTVERAESGDRSFSDPIGYASESMGRLRDLTNKWLSAAVAAHAFGMVS
jgi:hypothetical protein